MKGIKIFLSFFISCLVNIEAFPYEAGHCSSGSLGGKSGTHGSFGGGDPIGQGGFTITIGGMSPSLGSTLELIVGQEYPVKIERTNGSFRGLLFRLPGAGVFSAPSSDGFKLHPSCSADVSAVTHSDNNDKSLVEFTLKYESAGEKSLDVTTLITKSSGNWFYSSYLLNFVAEATPSPTSTPTKAPTLAPTASPTLSPTPIPTIAPTSTPTKAPTPPPIPGPITPTGSPTSAPTDSPTPEPTPGPAFVLITASPTTESNNTSGAGSYCTTFSAIFVIAVSSHLLLF